MAWLVEDKVTQPSSATENQVVVGDGGGIFQAKAEVPIVSALMTVGKTNSYVSYKINLGTVRYSTSNAEDIL